METETPDVAAARIVAEFCPEHPRAAELREAIDDAITAWGDLVQANAFEASRHEH